MHTADSTRFRHTRRPGIPNPNSKSGEGALPIGGPYFFELGGFDDTVSSVMIRWFTVGSNATIQLETTNLPFEQATFDSAVATEWALSPAVVTGPTGVAAGCSMLHIANRGTRRYRLKVTASAITELDIIPYGVH